jgi:hypothetical protein
MSDKNSYIYFFKILWQVSVGDESFKVKYPFLHVHKRLISLFERSIKYLELHSLQEVKLEQA